jgi:putative ABC transport system ATP-binding protein
LTLKMTEQTVLEAQSLFKSHFSSAGEMTILKKINFKIKKGEFVCIVGPSGSGKSTLLNILGTLDRPTSGKILIDGEDVFSLNEHGLAFLRNRKIGFVFQSYNLINRATILKNIEIPCIISGISKKERLERIYEIMSILGIEDKANYKPFSLSGGQQQRAAIARALVTNPAIVLADEPTGNLDTKTGREVLKLLKTLSFKYNTSIIMVTHNQELALQTDRIIYLKDGEIEKEECLIK